LKTTRVPAFGDLCACRLRCSSPYFQYVSLCSSPSHANLTQKQETLHAAL